VAVAALKTHGLMAVGLVLVAMLVGVFTAGPVVAQAVRAALVSNVDDPGRIPYSASANCFFQGTDHCVTQLPPVLAGKRLVITHASGEVSGNLPPGTALKAVVSGLFADAHLVPTYAGYIGGVNEYVFDQSLLLFFDAGQSPSVLVLLGGVSIENGGYFRLSGYMLDCVNGPCAKVVQEF